MLFVSACAGAPSVVLNVCPQAVETTAEVADDLDRLPADDYAALWGWIADQLVQDEQIDACHASSG